jgi:hypothetical protein
MVNVKNLTMLVVVSVGCTAPAGVSVRANSGTTSIRAKMAGTLRVGPVLFDRPRAGLVVRSDYEPGEGGLLPTSMFEAIYFDTARNEVVVVPRR